VDIVVRDVGIGASTFVQKVAIPDIIVGYRVGRPITGGETNRSIDPIAGDSIDRTPGSVGEGHLSENVTATNQEMMAAAVRDVDGAIDYAAVNPISPGHQPGGSITVKRKSGEMKVPYLYPIFGAGILIQNLPLNGGDGALSADENIPGPQMERETLVGAVGPGRDVNSIIGLCGDQGGGDRLIRVSRTAIGGVNGGSGVDINRCGRPSRGRAGAAGVFAARIRRQESECRYEECDCRPVHVIPDFQMRWVILIILKMDKGVVNGEQPAAGEK
jgi:hypothetical protein